MSAVMMRGAGRPGISAVVMMMSTSLRLLGVQRRLAGLVVVAHLLGVASGRDFGRRGVDVEVLPAEGLDLVGDLGARVGGLDDGAHAACRADGGQTGDPCADHEHLGGRHLARRGHLPGEEPAEGVRGFDDSAVPGDVGHRRQHVQRLRPRDARDGVHRQHRDRAGGELLDELWIQRRRDQADQGGLVLQRGDLDVGGGVDLEYYVGGPRTADFGACFDVGGIGEAGGVACPGLDGDGVAQFDELSDGLRRGGDTRLTRVRLARYPDNHRKSLPSAARACACASGGKRCAYSQWALLASPTARLSCASLE